MLSLHDTYNILLLSIIKIMIMVKDIKTTLRWSIGKRLIIALLLGSIIPLITISYITIHETEVIVKERVSDQFNNEAINRGIIIKNVIEQSREQVDILTVLLNTNNDIEAKKSIINSFLNRYHNKVASMMVTDANGKVIISSDKSLEGDDLSRYEPFIQSKVDQYVGFENHDGRALLTIASPLGADRFDGSLIIRFMPDLIESVLLNREGLGETGETYLVNKDRVMITESRFIDDAAFNQRVDTLPVKECFVNGISIASQIYPDYRNVPIFGTSYCIKEYGIVLLAEIDVEEINGSIKRLEEDVLYSIIAVSIAVAGFAYYIGKRISRPITKIAEITSRVGKGDLTVEVKQVNGRDEVSMLAINTNNTIRNLRSLLIKIRDTVDTLSKNIQRISISSNQVNSASQQLANTAQQISKGSQEQAEKINNVNRLLNTLTDNMKKSNENMLKAATITNEMANISKSGSKVASSAIESMQLMIDASNRSVEKMRSLVEKTSKITSVLDVIQKIAEQTNMLALNAAIEAARAGEAGRGFAVVSEEVRNLARGSSKASEEIAKLINEIQSDAVATAQSIESNSNEIMQGKQSVDNALRILSDIVKRTEEIERIVKEVSNIVISQLKHVEEINDNVSKIASVAQENAAATEEAAASLEEQSASIEELTIMANNIAKISQELDSMIKMFKIEGSSIIREASKIDNSIDSINGEAIEQEVK